LIPNGGTAISEEKEIHLQEQKNGENVI